jgi:hypothetical protein
MKVFKSKNHRKITGNFGEYLTLYHLSRHGFECAHIDHVGIDLIASHPHTAKWLGISVKSRSRNPGTEKTGLIINAGDYAKAKEACVRFRCELYFSIVVDRGSSIFLYLLPGKLLQKKWGTKTGRAYWRMTESAIEKYRKDRKIAKFEMQTSSAWGDLDVKSAKRSKGTKLKSL